jgi:hypothetical protein
MSLLEIKDPREDKAVVVGDAWHRLNSERINWLTEALEIRRYLTATSTKDTEVGSLPWKNKTRIPKLTQIKDTLQSWYMAALFPNDEWLRWEGIDAESHKKANVIEQYMLTKTRMGAYRKETEKTIDDWVTYGNAFSGVKWVVETTKSAVTGEEIVNYIGPRKFRISPMDVVIDPRAKTFDDSLFIWRKMMPIADFVAAFEESNPEAVAKVKELRSPDTDQTDWYKEEGFAIDGFDAFGSYLKSGYVEVLEYWGDLFVCNSGEVLRNRKVCIADRSFAVEDIENPAWNGKKPFAHDSWRRLPENLWGQSPLAQLVGMQYRIDHLENLKADVFDQTAHPVQVIKGDDGEDAYEWKPGAQWHIPIDGDVQVLRPDASVLAVDNELAFYINMMEQMAGSPKEASGFRTPGEKTAFEVGVLQQGSDRMFLDKTNSYQENVMERELNLMLEMTIRNLDIADVARTFNDDTNALILTELTKEDVVADGVLRPVGAKHFAKRAQRIQEINNFMAMSEHPSMAPHFSGFRAAQAIQEELGFEKFGIVERDIAIKEQAMTQATAATIQQQMQQVLPQQEDVDETQ